jgi:predicted RNA polymerase sigma factor
MAAQVEVEPDAAVRAGLVARAAYGRLLAILAARDGDLASAEDALSDAFRIALETWPTRGVPANPTAWLLTAARNRHRDAFRRSGRFVSLEELAVDFVDREEPVEDAVFPDERLKLLFVCAHPAIEPAMHTPLMLQSVLGLPAQAIARAFAVPTATMAQRLVRVKHKIKEAGIPFLVPDRDDLASRLEAVRAAIYAAYASELDRDAQNEVTANELGGEALFLADLLCRLLPGDPETLGLSALLAFCEARRPARRDEHGRFVPLDSQDTSLWDRGLIAHAEQCLFEARTHGRLGRYQLEAAIQSVHADRARSGKTDWPSLVILHDALLQRAPSLGGAVGRAVALAHAHDAEAGLAALAAIDPAAAAIHQPYWAALAHLNAVAGNVPAAVAAYEQAIALTTDPAVTRYLVGRRVLIAGGKG